MWDLQTMKRMNEEADVNVIRDQARRIAEMKAILKVNTKKEEGNLTTINR